MTLLYLANDREIVVDTNFWESAYNTLGAFFLSQNAGAARLLVPDGQADFLEEIKATRYVDFERSVLAGQKVLHLWFEDGTPTPFRLRIGEKQFDFWPRLTNASMPLLICTRDGIVQRHRVRKVC